MKIGLFFLYLSIVNLFDGILTYIGVREGFIEEKNPLMNSLINESAWLFLMIKGILSLLLLLLTPYFKKRTVSDFLFGLTLFAVLVYSAVSLIHLFWLLHF